MSGARHPNHRDPASLPVELRRVTVPGPVRGWVARAAGSPVLRVRRLAGASSTAVHRVDLDGGGRLVLRRYVWPGFLEDEPIAPQREVDALRFAAGHGPAAPGAAAPELVVPELVAADVDGSEVGDGVPVLLMALLPGRAVAVPDPVRLAEVAASIHSVGGSGPAASAAFGHEWLPWFEGTTVGPPPGSSRPGLWERAIDVWHRARPDGPATFVHRDFHPGNVLWSRGRATGVVDWANACRGPWGCDVGTCRVNLRWLGDPAAADEFLAAYESATGHTYDPYWEIASMLERDPSHARRAVLADDEERLARALAELGAR